MEEGRHESALGLYREALAAPPLLPSSSCSSSVAPAQPSEGANPPEEENELAVAAAAATVTGDALHGVGVALLAAGRFKAACRAWERCGLVWLGF